MVIVIASSSFRIVEKHSLANSVRPNHRDPPSRRFNDSPSSVFSGRLPSQPIAPRVDRSHFARRQRHRRRLLHAAVTAVPAAVTALKILLHRHPKTRLHRSDCHCAANAYCCVDLTPSPSTLSTAPRWATTCRCRQIFVHQCASPNDSPCHSRSSSLP